MLMLCICTARLVSQPRHDLLDYLSGLSGVVGVLIALSAFIYSLVQSDRTNRRAIQERRTEFELGLLAEIRRQMSITGLQHLAGYVGALITDPENKADIPVLRAAVGTKATESGRIERDRISDTARGTGVDPRQALISHAEAEVDSAIQRRLDRDPTMTGDK